MCPIATRAWNPGGVARDHLLTIDSPIGANPFLSTNPFGSSEEVDAIAGYGVPGSGGLQPVALAGPTSHRRDSAERRSRRPVVGTLDTGCGAHSWLDRIVDTTVTIDGAAIRDTDPLPDPEVYGDLVGRLGGSLDAVSGRGARRVVTSPRGCRLAGRSVDRLPRGRSEVAAAAP